jgi:hypothetical protein
MKKAICSLSFACSVLLGATTARADFFSWTWAQNGDTGPSPVGGGIEGSLSTFVCKVPLADGSVIVGKLSTADGVCYVSQQGSEQSYSNYQVLQSRSDQQVGWQPNGGSVPLKAVPGGIEWGPRPDGTSGWNTTFICIANDNAGDLIIGRYLYWNASCNYGLGGTEYSTGTFQVLVQTN